jgi:hypothetical protein
MKTIKSALVAGVASIALASAAAASGTCPGPNPCPPNTILNGQLNIGSTISNVQTNVQNVTGEVTVTSAAIANSLSVDVTGDAMIGNTQQNFGYVGSTLNATVAHTKDVSLTSAAIANSASIKVMEADTLEVNNLQTQAWDPAAYLTAHVSDIDGGATLTAAGISNSLAVETDAALIRVGTTQRNQGPNIASVNATVRSISGDVSITGAAIANSVSIKTGL